MQRQKTIGVIGWKYNPYALRWLRKIDPQLKAILSEVGVIIIIQRDDELIQSKQKGNDLKAKLETYNTFPNKSD